MRFSNVLSMTLDQYYLKPIGKQVYWTMSYKPMELETVYE
jgi:hypothetical protein